jgi:hypothetical protein
MKNLFALVFFFPLAVFAGGDRPETTEGLTLKGLPYTLTDENQYTFSTRNPGVEEYQRLYRNCCVLTEESSEKSIFYHKKRNWIRHLRETQRVQLSIFDSEAVLSSRNYDDGAWHLGKVGKHGRVYGIEYRRTAGILDGSPRSFEFITRWFSSPDDP